MLYLIIFIFIKLLTLTCCKIYYIFIQFFEYNVNYIIVFFFFYLLVMSKFICISNYNLNIFYPFPQK